MSKLKISKCCEIFQPLIVHQMHSEFDSESLVSCLYRTESCMQQIKSGVSFKNRMRQYFKKRIDKFMMRYNVVKRINENLLPFTSRRFLYVQGFRNNFVALGADLATTWCYNEENKVLS